MSESNDNSAAGYRLARGGFWARGRVELRGPNNPADADVSSEDFRGTARVLLTAPNVAMSLDDAKTLGRVLLAYVARRRAMEGGG